MGTSKANWKLCLVSKSSPSMNHRTPPYYEG